jgi:hypothetical protein
MHRLRLKRHGDVNYERPRQVRPAWRTTRICAVEGCEKLATAGTMCHMHFNRLQRHGDVTYERVRERSTRTCDLDGCEREHAAKGLCQVHYMRLTQYGSLDVLTTEARFWAKVDKDGPIPEYRPDLGPCWLWTGAISVQGYSKFWNGASHTSGHRYSVILHGEVIPRGLTVDHLCRVRHCVRASHLEVVSMKENTRRAADLITHCPKGHPYDDANVYINKQGYRLCRTCKQIKKPSHVV